MKIGANYLGNGRCQFIVWGPFLDKVELKIVFPEERIISMVKDDVGYWRTTLDLVSTETLYLFRLDGDKDRPDPASNSQPNGVHGPAEIIDHKLFKWSDDDWNGIDISRMVIYELHVGTFTDEGTFEAIIPRLNEIYDVGINAIELMPVAQFPGERNWGYDGVFPFAPQNSYGGSEGLKTLIDKCHENGIAVILDVVYNHLGPEGNYLSEYGPYYTERYKTPWGKAINFDDAYSDEVRNFFIQNALYWFDNHHVDTLRLDAVHSICDMSSKHILEELSEEVTKYSIDKGKKHYLIAESALNDIKVIKKTEEGGYGIDAQWSDDLHHSLHALLTAEKNGYYVDFGQVNQLGKSLKEGFVYSGEYSSFRKKRYGSFSGDIPGKKFIVYSQNHDQAGNRLNGERLSSLVNLEGLKLAAGVVIFSPNIPLLFMGEEYGEESPFLYFVSHSDRKLIDAVRGGRRHEFKAFSWKGKAPDPQSIGTFLNSRIDWEKRKVGRNKVLLNYYKKLIALRNSIPSLSNLDKKSLEVVSHDEEKVLVVKRRDLKCKSSVLMIFNFNKTESRINANFKEGTWKKVLDSSEEIWGGPGSLVPFEVNKGQELTLAGHGLVLYETNAAWNCGTY